MAALKKKHIKELRTLLATCDNEAADLKAGHAATVAAIKAELAGGKTQLEEAATKAAREQEDALAQKSRECSARLEASLLEAAANAAAAATAAKQKQEAAVSQEARVNEAKTREAALKYTAQIEGCATRAAEKISETAQKAKQALDDAVAQEFQSGAIRLKEGLKACSESAADLVAAQSAHAKEITALNEDHARAVRAASIPADDSAETHACPDSSSGVEDLARNMGAIIGIMFAMAVKFWMGMCAAQAARATLEKETASVRAALAEATAKLSSKHTKKSKTAKPKQTAAKGSGMFSDSENEN